MTITTPETPPGTAAPITDNHPATLAFRLFGITIASIEFDHPDLTSGWLPKAAPLSPVPTQVRRASRRFARWVITPD